MNILSWLSRLLSVHPETNSILQSYDFFLKPPNKNKKTAKKAVFFMWSRYARLCVSTMVATSITMGHFHQTPLFARFVFKKSHPQFDFFAYFCNSKN